MSFRCNGEQEIPRAITTLAQNKPNEIDHLTIAVPDVAANRQFLENLFCPTNHFGSPSPGEKCDGTEAVPPIKRTSLSVSSEEPQPAILRKDRPVPMYRAM